MAREFNRKVKNTYQLKMSNRRSVDDGCTKWTECWFIKEDSSALIINSLKKVNNEK